MRKRLARVLFIGIVAFGLLVTALWDRVLFVLEEQSAARTKAERIVQYGLGLPLPGTPDTSKLQARLSEQGHALGAPVFIRIFKAESEFEIWLRRDQAYEKFATYPICRWSGRLGPKLTQGDRQAPEGVYTVAANQLNPNSRWHRSFNLGFPNVVDRTYKRTGTFLMVHGGCSSAGCYAMTDPVIDEIWQLVSAALEKGQPRFHVHIYPFRMTAKNLQRHKNHPWHSFWSDLKYGHDLFEATHVPPRVSACNGHYAFASVPPGQDQSSPLEAECPDIAKDVPRPTLVKTEAFPSAVPSSRSKAPL